KLARFPAGDRTMVAMLTAVLCEGMGAVACVCAEAVRASVHSASVILHVLTRPLAPTAPVTILPPESLRLRHAPVADCARYDRLRRAP
ncbi:IS21 family transposase, partial [Methylobacterium sp. E-065]|nr:IS21 family transposase [Methylobacterium sp. E-065]